MIGPFAFTMIEVDILDVSSEKFISSWKTKVFSDQSIKFAHCNMQGEFLVSTCEVIDDDFFDIMELKIFFRKSNSQTNLWERNCRKYYGDSFSPQFVISPKRGLL